MRVNKEPVPAANGYGFGNNNVRARLIRARTAKAGHVQCDSILAAGIQLLVLAPILAAAESLAEAKGIDELAARELHDSPEVAS